MMLTKIELGIAIGTVITVAGLIVGACTSLTVPLTIGLLATGSVLSIIFNVAELIVVSQELASGIKQVKTDKVPDSKITELQVEKEEDIVIARGGC